MVRCRGRTNPPTLACEQTDKSAVESFVTEHHHSKGQQDPQQTPKAKGREREETGESDMQAQQPTTAFRENRGAAQTHAHTDTRTCTRARTHGYAHHGHTRTRTRMHAHGHRHGHAHTHGHARTHTHTRTRTLTHIHAHAHTDTHACTRTRTHTHRHAHTHTGTRTHMGTCAHGHTRMHTDTDTRAHTGTHTHTGTRTHIHTHAHTHTRTRTRTHPTKGQGSRLEGFLQDRERRQWGTSENQAERNGHMWGVRSPQGRESPRPQSPAGRWLPARSVPTQASLSCAGRTKCLQRRPVGTEHLRGLLRSSQRRGGAQPTRRERDPGPGVPRICETRPQLCWKSGRDQKMQKGQEGTIITSRRHRSCLRGDAHSGGKLPMFGSGPGSLGSRRAAAGPAERQVSVGGEDSKCVSPGWEAPLSPPGRWAALLSSVLTWDIESGAQLYEERRALRTGAT